MNVFDAGLASAGGTNVVPSPRAAGIPTAQRSMWRKKTRRDLIV
jgi:hypothetical protein